TTSPERQRGVFPRHPSLALGSGPVSEARTTRPQNQLRQELLLRVTGAIASCVPSPGQTRPSAASNRTGAPQSDDPSPRGAEAVCRLPCPAPASADTPRSRWVAVPRDWASDTDPAGPAAPSSPPDTARIAACRGRTVALSSAPRG